MDNEERAAAHKMAVRYHWTEVVCVRHNDQWASTPESPVRSNVSNAVEKALDILTGRHLLYMRLVSVSHSPVTFNDGSTWLVVTVVVEPYKIEK